MNVFYVVLLSLISMVLNATDDQERFNTVLGWGKDFAVYTWAPEIVDAAVYRMPASIKNNLQLSPFIARQLPDVVNRANAGRVLITALARVLSHRSEFDTYYDGKNILQEEIPCFVIKLAYDQECLKEDLDISAKAVRDATVAIAAVEVLSCLVSKLGGERSAEIAAHYTTWINCAKAACYTLFTSVSAKYFDERFDED